MVCERSGDFARPFRDSLIINAVVVLVVISTTGPVSAREGVRAERCLLWGPGLTRDAVLPVRYFFIQAVGSNGENLTVSPGNPLAPRLLTRTERRVTALL